MYIRLTKLSSVAMQSKAKSYLCHTGFFRRFDLPERMSYFIWPFTIILSFLTLLQQIA